MRQRIWKTKAGVLVAETERALFRVRAGRYETKIRGRRLLTGGEHGWLWLKNLAPAKPREVARAIK